MDGKRFLPPDIFNTGQMKITLLTVGQTERGWIADGLKIYSARLSHFVPFTVREIPDIRNASSLSREQVKTKEGEMILKNLKDTDEVILLDEHGKEYSSVEWAGAIGKKLDAGARDLVFVIGGPYGFSKEVYGRSSGLISMSRMTFSHQMARIIFTEQLYRAFTIIRGLPYHHE